MVTRSQSPTQAYLQMFIKDTSLLHGKSADEMQWKLPVRLDSSGHRSFEDGRPDPALTLILLLSHSVSRLLVGLPCIVPVRLESLESNNSWSGMAPLGDAFQNMFGTHMEFIYIYISL